MHFKKKRKSVKKGKNRLKGLLFFSSVSLLCLFALGFLYLSKHDSNTTPLIFEEAYSTTPDLTSHVTQIDHLIYEAIYMNGTEEKDVIFSAVNPMQDGTNYWNFTELQIKEEDLKAVNRLKDILAHNLAEFKPVVTFHMEDVSDKEIVFNIFISELHTHRICMIYYNGDVKETMSPCPKIAIIIDDLGYDKKIAEAFIDIDLPLNLSVLPYAPFTEHVIKLAAKRGREILLHLPLEPKDYPSLNPGPGTLLRNMGDDEIREKLDGIFRQTPGISGVNHHMGSHFTESSDKMSVVMSEIKKRGLFYVDSRTTALTVGYDIAKKIGVPAAKKSLFFDHDVTTMAIKYQMERLLSIARYSGSAVGIGHPHPETLEILSQYEDKLKQEYRVVPVSSLVN